MEIEVIDITKNSENVFKVDIEIISTRERRSFCYPAGDGWEDEVDGKPRFLTDIQHKLQQEMERKNIDLDNLEKYKGQKAKVNKNNPTKKKKNNAQRE